MSSNDPSKIDARVSAARAGFLATSPSLGRGFKDRPFLVPFAPGHHMLRFEIPIRRHGLRSRSLCPTNGWRAGDRRGFFAGCVGGS
jgi:hypothetical protein